MGNTRLSRRHFLRLSATAAAGAFVTACVAPTAPAQPAAPQAGPTAPAAAPAATGPVTITYWHGWTERWETWVKEFIDSFQKFQDKVKVNYVVVPSSEQVQKLLASVAGGSPPDCITFFGSQDIPGLASEGNLLAYNDFALGDDLAKMKEWYTPAAWSLGLWRGKVYGTGSTYGNLALTWNKKVFAEVGLPDRGPNTIAELDDWAQKLTTLDKNGNIDRMGFNPASYGASTWISHMANFGGRVYDAQGDEFLANDPKNVAALEWVQTYSKKFDVKKLQAFESGLAGERAGTLDPFVAGRLAMQVVGIWKPSDYVTFADKGFEYGVAPLPPVAEGDNQTGGGTYIWGNYQCMPKGAKNLAASVEWAKYWAGLSDPSTIGNYLLAWQGIPTVAVGCDPQKQLSFPEVKAIIDKVPQFKVFIDLMGSPRAVTAPVTPVTSKFLDRLNAEVDKARFLDKTAKEALDTVQTDIKTEYDQWKQTHS